MYWFSFSLRYPTVDTKPEMCSFKNIHLIQFNIIRMATKYKCYWSLVYRLIKHIKSIITDAEKQAHVDSFQCHLHTLMLPINKKSQNKISLSYI